MTVAAVFIVAALSVNGVRAANNDVWSGNTDNTWNNAANWNPTAVPGSGDQLFFGVAGSSGAALNDNIAGGGSFGGFTFSNNATAFTFTNNSVGVNLAGGITNNSTANFQTIKLIITNSTGITISDAGGGTALSNSIFGVGGVTNSGSGTLTLGGSQNGNTFTGGVTVNNGMVQVRQPSTDGNTYLGVGNVTVNSGGILLGVTGDAFGFAGHPCPTNIYINAGGTVSNITGGTLTLPNLIFTGGTITSSNGDAGTSGSAFVFNGNGTVMDITTLPSSSTATMAQGGTGAYKVNKPTVFNIASGSAPGGVDMLISGVLNNSKGITKTGNGTLELSGTNVWTGPLTNMAGVVALTGFAALPASEILITNGATFDVSGLISAYTLASGKILAGDGEVNGAMVAAANSTIDAGFYGGHSLGFLNNLSLQGNTNKFVLSGTLAGLNSQINVAGNLDFGGAANTISLSGFASLQSGSYPLFTYGTESTLGSWNLLGFSATGRQTAAINDSGSGQVSLVVSGNAANLVWVGDGSANDWDLSTPNWLNGGTQDQFYNNDLVIFNDSSTNTTVTIATTVQPGLVTVSNNLDSYTFTGGGGAISGAGQLVKEGTNTLLMQESGGDTFSGGILVSNGTLILDNDFATISGGLTIASGATAQIGLNDTPNGNTLPAGPIVDNGTLVFDRSDSPNESTVMISGTGGVSQLGGGTLTLSSAGANTFAGNIVISNGTIAAPARVAADGSASSLGAFNVPGRTVTIGPGATLSGTLNNWFGTASSVPDADFPSITVNGGTVTSTRYTAVGNVTLLNGANLTQSSSDPGTNYGGYDIRGTVTVGGTSASTISSGNGAPDDLGTNSTIFNVAITSGSGPDLMVSTGLRDQSGDYGSDPANPNGNTFPSGLIKAGGGTMLLEGTNSSYSGPTTISNGVLAFDSVATISNTPSIAMANNAIIDVSARADDTLNLVGAQVLSGTGTILGSVSNTTATTMSPGTPNATGTLTVTNVADFSGTNLMKLNATAGTNDLIAGAQLINYDNGTLTVVNIAGTLTANQTFQLFSAASYSGTFGSINLPTLNAGLAWNTSNLAVNGTIQVISTGPSGPTTNAPITAVRMVGANIVISGTNNNVPNTSFHYAVLVSTNITVPLTNWTAIATNGFNADGTYEFTNPIVPGTPQQFFDTIAVP